MNTKKQNAFFCGTVAAAIIAIAVILFLLLRSCGKEETENLEIVEPGITVFDLAPSGALSENGPAQRGAEEILADLNRQVAEGMITMSMNPDPVYKDGKSNGSLLIHNDESNRYAQHVRIVRDDTGETVYTSGLIPVGRYVNADTLDKPLPAGDYPCTAYFSSVDGSGAVLGTGAVHITIHVEN